MRRASIFSRNDILQLADFESSAETISDTLTNKLSKTSLEKEQPLEHYLQQDERSYIIHMLRKHHLRIAETAEVLGLSRTGLWQKMKRLDIHKGRL